MKGTGLMSRLRITLSQLCVVLSLALGRMPRMMSLLDLLHEPRAAYVLISRRRRLSYADFFTPLDPDGRRAAPLAHAATAPASQQPVHTALAPERYIPVDTA